MTDKWKLVTIQQVMLRKYRNIGIKLEDKCLSYDSEWLEAEKKKLRLLADSFNSIYEKICEENNGTK